MQLFFYSPKIIVYVKQHKRDIRNPVYNVLTGHDLAGNSSVAEG